MGNNNNAIAGVQVYRTSRPGEWVRQGTTGYCDIVKNAQTGEIAEQYSIPIDQGLSFEEELRLYEMRRNQPRIVRVLQVEKENTTHFCQGQEFLRVKTEHIPKRLSDFEKLSHNEGFYVLLEVLRGYQAIHRFQPRFTINREMVGFTPEGQVRVWLNENFAKNSPDLPRVQRSQRPNVRPQSLFALIEPIIDIVRQSMKQLNFPTMFGYGYLANPPETFEQAISYTENYLAETGMTLPSAISMTSVQATTQISATNQPTATVIAQTQPNLNARSQLLTRPVNIGGRSQISFQPQQSGLPRAVSVGPYNHRSQLVLNNKPFTSTLPAAQSRIATRPLNLSLSQAQLQQNLSTSVNRQQLNANRTFDLSTRFGLRQQTTPTGRQPIAFRLNNARQNATIPNKITDQVQFTRRGQQSFNSSLPTTGLVSHITSLNSKYAGIDIKPQVTVATAVQAISQETDKAASIEQGKVLSEALNIEANKLNISSEAVQRNYTTLIAETKPATVTVQQQKVRSVQDNTIRFGVQQNQQSYQPIKQQQTLQSTPTQQAYQSVQPAQNVTTQQLRQQQTFTTTTRTGLETKGEVKEVDINSAPKIIRLDAKTIPVERIIHKAGGGSGIKKESEPKGQDTPAFNYKFQGSPQRIEAKAEAKQIPIYRVGEARVIGTSSPTSQGREHSQSQSPERRVIQPQQQYQSYQRQQQVSTQQATTIAQPRVIVVDELTLTENARGIVEAHEEVITTEVDARGNSTSSGYVVEYNATSEPEITGGVTYSTTQITDYTAAEDSAGHQYIRSHTYEYNNDNPVKEYERYIDSSTGVDRLESFRVGEQRPRLPVDYQQIVSNATPQSYTMSQQSNAAQIRSRMSSNTQKWIIQDNVGGQHQVFSTYQQGYKLPSYSELSKKIASSTGSTRVDPPVTKGPEHIPHPIRVKAGLLD